MDDGRVEIDVIMDDGSVRKGTANINKQLNDLGTSATGAGSKIKGIAGAVGAVAVVGAAFQGLKSVIGDAVSRVDTLNNSNRTFKNMGFSAQESKSAMEALDKSIKGLPTSLDSAVSGVQMLAGSTGDIGKSQQLFSALNDGIIGFGGSAENVSETVRQLSQAFAGGKVDAETWNSMLDNGLGPALNAVAKKMGMTSASLKAGLSDGSVSVEAFQNALIDLDKNGGGGLVSLHQIAKDATAGIGTNFANMKTAAVRAMASVLTVLQGPITGAINILSSTFSYLSKGIDLVANAIKKIVAGGGPLGAVFQVIGAAVSGAGAAIAVFVGIIAGLYVFNQIASMIRVAAAAIMAFAGPITIAIAAVAGLIVAFTTLYNSSATFKSAIDGIKGALSPLKAVIDAVKSSIKVFADAFNAARTATDGAKTSTSSGTSVFQSFLNVVNRVATAVSGFLTTAIQKLNPIIQQLGTWLGTGSNSAAIAAGVFTKVGLAIAGISGPIGIIIGLIASLVTKWLRTGELNFNGLISSVQNLASSFVAALPQVVTFATNLITTLTNGIIAALPQLVTIGTQIVTSIVNAIATALPQIVQAGVQILTGIVNAIVSALPTLVSAATQIITTLLNGIIAILPMLLMAGIQILTALMNGIITMLPMLITAGLQILMALVNAIITNLPQILQAVIQIMMALMNGIVTMLPMLLQSAIQIIMALVNGLIANLPQIITAAVQLIVALVTGIISVLPQLVMAALQLMVALLGAIIQAAPQLLAAGVQLILALVSGVLSIIGALIGAAVQLGSALIGAIINFVGQMLSAGVQLVGQVVSGIASGIGKAASTAKSVASGAVSAVSGFASQMLSAGKNFVSGFVNGIKRMAGEALSAAKDMASKAVNAAKSLLHIHSPSRVMYAIGAYTGEGFTNGIKSYVDQAGKASKQLANAAIIKPSEMSYSGNLLSGLFNGSITAESALGINGKLAPTSSVVNNYNNTTNNGDGSSDKALDYLKQIANKNTVVDGSSFANRLSSFSSSANANRQAMTDRGLSIDNHI